MYKVFSLAPMFIPYGVYQTYEEAFAVVKRVDDFLMVIDECDEDGSIIDKYHLKNHSLKIYCDNKALHFGEAFLFMPIVNNPLTSTWYRT